MSRDIVTAGSTCSPTRRRRRPAPVTRVDWRPPMAGTSADLAPVAGRPAPRRGQRRLRPAGCSRRRPHLVDVVPAGEALGLAHARRSCTPGRRSTWERASGPAARRADRRRRARGAGRRPARRPSSCTRAARVKLGPCHHRRDGRADGRRRHRRRCGCSCSRTRPPARRAYCTLNEGLGKVLRYGAYGPEVLDRLRWMAARARARAAGRACARTARSTSRRSCAQMLQMGDEAHNRNRAGT